MQGSKPRKCERYVVEGMDIHARTIFNIEADVLDLSLSGASIRSTQRLNMGSPYTFRFTKGDDVISITGVVVWAKLVGSQKDAKGQTLPVYSAGVQFSGVLTEQAHQLVEHIKSVLGESAGKRVAGIRLRFLEPEEAVLIEMGEYAVTDVGLGGIRIEVDRDFTPERVLLLELVPSTGAAAVCFTGRIAYCREIPGTKVRTFSVGIEIVEMEEEEKARWKEFVETLSPGGMDP